ncbi:protease inhibitor I9 family protein [Virgibacillus soli]|uniref:Protease inhibitor I9 family protein n=1 Tax=Paracerasibacillus soli TaxID=480284 RepID=A0ABU5CVC6_9BACI|nr:protease inhibitor I9 family protein [Virgibacillus soli]MDY0410195.1 protease inhibitor I9 family protein [Virgibacillus soli]
MNSSIYVDPKIDLNSEESIEVIIQFKTNPAKVQIALSDAGLTLDQAMQNVEESHKRFEAELIRISNEHLISFDILNRYKEVYNGVAMRIQGVNIKYLLQSSEMKAIHLNSQMSIPIQPNDPRYQI